MSQEDIGDRIDDLFLSAIELPLEERRSFIDRETQNDPDEVRQRVLELLAAEDEVDGEFAAPSPLNLQSLSADDLPDPRLGEQIGGYVLQDRVASGGFGTVYRATRDEPYKEEVAIKLLHRENLAAPPVVQRVLREMQALSDLRHPNIVSQLQSGLTENGEPYIVMEFVRGRTLNEHCDEFCLSIEERLKLFQKICDAVSFAHQNNWVHRDLKPSNILVTDDGIPKLLDFGIAKLGGAGPVDVQATLTRGIIGTPQYMSPEQFSGRPAGPAADVYALGAILYELLSGHRAFDVMCGGLDQAVLDVIQRAVCEMVPKRPSTVVTNDATATGLSKDLVASRRQLDPSTLRRCLQGDIDNIAMMALRKEPDRRYASADELKDDIQRWLEHHPVRARNDSIAYRMQKFARRNRIAIAVSLALLLSGMIGVLSVNYGRKALRERDVEATAKFIESAKGAFREDDLPKAIHQLELASDSARNGTPTSRSIQMLLSGWNAYRGIEISPGLATLASETRTANGSVLVETDEAGTTRMWNSQTWKVERELATSGPLKSQILSPDGGWLARLTTDGQVDVYDLRDGEKLELGGILGDVLAVAFRDGELFLLSQTKSHLCVWKQATRPQNRERVLGPPEQLVSTPFPEPVRKAWFRTPYMIVLSLDGNGQGDLQKRVEFRDTGSLGLLLSQDIDRLAFGLATSNLIAQSYVGNGEDQTVIWNAMQTKSIRSPIRGRVVDLSSDGSRVLLRRDRRYVIHSLRDGQETELDHAALTARSQATFCPSEDCVYAAELLNDPARHLQITPFRLSDGSKLPTRRYFYSARRSGTRLLATDAKQAGYGNTDIQFLSEGRRAVLHSESADGVCERWVFELSPFSLATGDFRLTKDASRSLAPIREVALDFPWVLAASESQIICRDLRYQNEIRETQIEQEATVLALAGKAKMAVAGYDNTVQLLQVPSLNPDCAPFRIAGNSIVAVDLIGEGDQLFVGTSTVLSLFDTQHLKRSVAAPTPIRQFFASDNEPLLGSSFDRASRTAIARTGVAALAIDMDREVVLHRRELGSGLGSIKALAIGRSHYVLARLHERRVKLHFGSGSDDASTITLVLERDATELAVSSDGRLLAVAYDDGSVQVVDALLGIPATRPMRGPGGSRPLLKFSPDAKLLIAVDPVGPYCVWSLEALVEAR